jgi:hypothetical protein
MHIERLRTAVNKPTAALVTGMVVVMLTATVACSTPTTPTTTSETAPAQSMSSPPSRQDTPMPLPAPSSTPVRIVIGDTVVTAELWDNAPAQALADRLPLTLTFSDLNAVEKTARLDPALPMTGMPEGDDPQPRDIGWYAPSSDVVLYYGDVGYWPGIARIGHIIDGIDTIAAQGGDFTATIERAT